MTDDATPPHPRSVVSRPTLHTRVTTIYDGHQESNRNIQKMPAIRVPGGPWEVEAERTEDIGDPCDTTQSGLDQGLIRC